MSSLRQQLVKEHLYLADEAAKLMFRRVQGLIEWDELLALGRAGLAEAASRYDAAAGASFATYAWYRVQGAILDGLRNNSHVPATIWKQLAALRQASSVLEAQAIGSAQADQHGAGRGTPAQAMRELADALALVAVSHYISIDGEAGAEAIATAQGAPGAHDTLARIDANKAARAVAAAIAALPEQQRVLIQKTYWEDMSLKEAGEVLGLSRSWASRLHLQALTRLRHALAAYA